MKYTLLILIIIIIAFVIGYRSNPKQFLPLCLTAIVAVSGWFIAHDLSAQRDRTNKQLDLRIKYGSSD
jgi:hypothetical protein